MDDTMSALEALLADIRKKTGVSVRSVPRGNGEFAFHADYCGKTVTLYLDAGEGAETAAKFVRYLLERRTEGAAPTRNEHLRGILLGEGGAWNAFRFLTKYKIADAPCFAVDLVPERRIAEAAQHIERCIEGGQDMVAVMDDTRIAVVRFGDGEDEQSPYAFGQFLAQSLYEELGVKASVGIGCEMRSFSEIGTSYHQAATAVRMGEIFESKGEVHTYREYLLVKMLEDIPKSRMQEYLEQFRIHSAEEVFEDAEMAGTAEEFLESSLNVSETSRNLFMHRNTLMYRLDKIERLTGLNIRKFSDAVTFRVIAILYRLLKNGS